MRCKRRRQRFRLGQPHRCRWAGGVRHGNGIRQSRGRFGQGRRRLGLQRRGQLHGSAVRCRRRWCCRRWLWRQRLPHGRFRRRRWFQWRRLFRLGFRRRGGGGLLRPRLLGGGAVRGAAAGEHQLVGRLRVCCPLPLLRRMEQQRRQHGRMDQRRRCEPPCTPPGMGAAQRRGTRVGVERCHEPGVMGRALYARYGPGWGGPCAIRPPWAAMRT